MNITEKLQAQACRWDGRWYAIPAVEVDCAAGLAKVPGPNGSIVEADGVFRVLDTDTGEIVDQTVKPGDPVIPLITPAMHRDDDPVHDTGEQP